MSDMHETVFLEIETDEAIWMRYAAAYAMTTASPQVAAQKADLLLEIHRERWPSYYEERE